jgi:hypothetical protein
MASTYTPLGIELMATGENAGTWGTKTNTNLSLFEQITGGFSQVSIAGVAQTTPLSVVDGNTTGTAQYRMIEFTGTITGNQVVTIPLDIETFYFLRNSTVGSFTVQFKYTSGSGTTATFATGDKGDKLLFAAANDATNPDIKEISLASPPGGSDKQIQFKGGAFTMTLPLSPTLGDFVSFIDYAGTFDTNNLTIGRNSENIQGSAADLTVSTERAANTLVYTDGTQGWLLTVK